ncbi:hypothetical protein JAAARDRAFT_200470 [Jaapia argillacea MUCL 33604]|uniref:Uncharacterized protein n=1 Tax=Jaapia argillacea MUCL 33604 TaxID=933084 RepID=A0A067P4P9_9AGAM|nr:hypothetical protein JAAARDRAFT_200470 [Jaapia argillacea MUCL 33604]
MATQLRRSLRLSTRKTEPASNRRVRSTPESEEYKPRRSLKQISAKKAAMVSRRKKGGKSDDDGDYKPGPARRTRRSKKGSSVRPAGSGNVDGLGDSGPSVRGVTAQEVGYLQRQVETLGGDVERLTSEAEHLRKEVTSMCSQRDAATTGIGIRDNAIAHLEKTIREKDVILSYYTKLAKDREKTIQENVADSKGHAESLKQLEKSVETRVRLQMKDDLSEIVKCNRCEDFNVDLYLMPTCKDIVCCRCLELSLKEALEAYQLEDPSYQCVPEALKEKGVYIINPHLNPALTEEARSLVSITIASPAPSYFCPTCNTRFSRLLGHIASLDRPGNPEEPREGIDLDGYWFFVGVLNETAKKHVKGEGYDMVDEWIKVEEER